jgi:hypothetical protein
MATKTLKFPGYPTGLTLTVDILNISTLSVIQTITLTESSGVYSGSMTATDAGQLLFIIKASGSAFDHRVRTIPDTAATFVVLTELEGVPDNGRGANIVTITVTNGVDNIEDATVRIQNSAVNVARDTDVDGIALFALDNGTYTITITKPAHDFVIDTLVVSGATTPPDYEIEETSPITPPASVLVSTGFMVVYDEFGEVEAGVPITVAMSTGRGTAGYALDTKSRTVLSDEAGYVEFIGLIRGATYAVRRGSSASPTASTFSGGPSGQSFVVPNASSFSLPEVIGADVEEEEE